jgi:hypothetical protein
MGNCNCKQGTNGTHHVCTECDILQLARNNYFTGKLLVERDFTDEQRYTMGKLRRHNQKLHGWGTVCGLKVEQHPNPACQSQYVVVEPGTAIDCCGREILLNCEEYFDFEARYLAVWQAQNGANAQPDANPHRLQICLSYKECPTEKVPALFDDCATGAGACQPNRILESHCLDVIIDGPSSQTDPPGVLLQWDFTENIANAIKVAEDDASQRLYVLTSASTSTNATATLYVVDTANYTLLTSVVLNNSIGLDVAVSPEGDFVYVAVQQTTSGTSNPTGAPLVNVYSVSNFTATANQLTVGTVSDPTVKLAIYPGAEGSLFTFGQAAGVTAWSGVNAAGPTPTALTAITTPVAMAVSSANPYAYVATSGSTSIAVISLASPATVSSTTIPVPTAPISLAIVSTTGNDKLAALDGAGNLYFVDIPSNPASSNVFPSVTGFTYSTTKQVLLSPGGEWAYVLEQDSSGNAYVQSVDEHAVETGATNYMGVAVAVGVAPQSETLSNDGTHLYIPYQGTSSTSGGIAIVNVLQQDCGDIFQTVIDCCPDCAEGNCLVLATINDYVYGDAVTDPTAGSPIGKDQIDNLTDRHLLVSTDVLTKAVQCILDQGVNTGPRGPIGPVGPKGPAGLNGTNGNNGAQGATGPGIDNVSVTFVPCSEASEAGGTLVPEASGNYTLDLTIPGCCNQSLTGIAGVSWSGNGGTVPYTELLRNGLCIAFSGNVNSADLTNNSIVLLVSTGPSPLTMYLMEIGLHITAGNFASPSSPTSNTFTAAAGMVNGLIFIASNPDLVQSFIGNNLLLLVKGDFIRDQSNNGVDGNHLPPWLPNYPNSGHTGDGIAGGTFESWFTLAK